MQSHAAQRKYPDELRERAVRMVVEIRQREGRGHGELARVGRQLGVHPEALRGWVKQAGTTVPVCYPSGDHVAAARQDGIGGQLVHHSDRGVQNTAIHYTQRLADIGAIRSAGSKGDSYDNAAAEAVNSLYKKELVNREGPWEDAGQVTVAAAEWVSWYNDGRLHSACGNIPPAEYENAWLTRKSHPIIMPAAKAS
jgi:transposase InsO family protein